MSSLSRAEILPKMAVPKSLAVLIHKWMKAPLEESVRALEYAAGLLNQGAYEPAAGLATLASAVAARHYGSRPKEATKLLILAEFVARKAARHEAIAPAQAAGISAFLGRDEMCVGSSAPARHWISNKIRILRREGYGAKQAAAIAYSMARKTGYRVPKVEGLMSHDPTFKTMALLGMLDQA
jgi:hypothetical protein